ncbi:amidohydrolase family protein [Candidatus Woesearchaeota archaeon]|nr:amidohydrolase family protein [Candidatus Woesearchaeota archaeon]
MIKIDIHAHVTNRPVEGITYKDATIKTLEQEMIKHHVEKTVLLATYFPHKGTGISNFRMLDWIKNYNLETPFHEFLLFGSLDFEKYFYQGYNELEELAERNELSGIKIYTSYQHIDLHGENFKQVLKLTEKYNLPLMFHMGYTHGRKDNRFIAGEVKPSELEFIAQNGQKMILCHLARPFTEELIEVVKRNKTIYADSSALLKSHVDLTKEFLNECGPEKLLFGTDFPVETYEDSIFVIENAMKDFSEKDKKQVYYKNAKKLILSNERKRISPLYSYYDDCGCSSWYEAYDSYEDFCS